jgi:hypothetical protein
MLKKPDNKNLFLKESMKKSAHILSLQPMKGRRIFIPGTKKITGQIQIVF